MHSAQRLAPQRACSQGRLSLRHLPCWDGVHTGRVGSPCPALGVGDPALWAQQGWWVHRGARSQEEEPRALGGERSDTSIQEGFLEGAALNREDEIEAHII